MKFDEEDLNLTNILGISDRLLISRINTIRDLIKDDTIKRSTDPNCNRFLYVIKKLASVADSLAASREVIVSLNKMMYLSITETDLLSDDTEKPEMMKVSAKLLYPKDLHTFNENNFTDSEFTVFKKIVFDELKK